MNEECVVGVYHSAKQAEQAVHVLHRAGYPTRQVSVVASSPSAQSAVAAELKLGDDSIRDAALGAGLGGVVGLLAGLGFMMVTGFGLIFVIGPLAMGLTSTTVGALLGSFIGWGVHKDHIQHYEACVKQGQVLVIATGNPLQLTHAQRILQETDVLEVHLHAKTSSEAAEVFDSCRPAPRAGKVVNYVAGNRPRTISAGGRNPG